MKLQQFAVGDRFEHAGKVWVKTGPLTASDEDGRTQVIARSAVLKPLTPPCPPAGQSAASPAALRAAFDVFVDRCRPLIDPARMAAFEAARDDFLRQLPEAQVGKAKPLSLRYISTA